MATAAAPNLENPKTTTDLNVAPSPVEDASSTQLSTDETKGTPDAAPLNTSECAAPTDIQKKMKRAERFGMPVTLSEEEKRNSRAERYLLLSPLIRFLFYCYSRHVGCG